MKSAIAAAQALLASFLTFFSIGASSPACGAVPGRPHPVVNRASWSGLDIIGEKTAEKPARKYCQQRRKPIDPWAQWRVEQKRREEKREKEERELERKQKERETLETNKRWEDKRTKLKNRFNAIDFKLALDQARADFTFATNRFSSNPTFEFVAHTNKMVKLTKQFVDAQQKAQSCFNPNALLSQVEADVFRFEKAHQALVDEIGRFNRTASGEEFDNGISDRPAFRRRRTGFRKQDDSAVAPEVRLPADKLRELKKLFDEGILTQEEYDAKRKELLESM